MPLYKSQATPWIAWTPTGSWSTNTTYTGFKRRVRDTYEYQVMIALAGAPTTATLTVTLAETMDTAKLVNSVGTIPRLGRADIRDTGAALYAGSVHYNSSTTVLVSVETLSVTVISIGSAVTQANPITFGNTDQIVLNFSAPVVGWG